MLGAGNLNKKWTIAARYVDTDLQRPRWRLTLDYRFSSRFVWGIEWNPSADELNPVRATYDLVKESDKTPLVSFGTSSDRIGSRVHTRAYYVTVGKAIPDTNVAPYFSVNYSEADKGLNFPFGANIRLNDQWSMMPMNDGSKSHLLLTYQRSDYWVTLGWIWFRTPGIAVGWGF